MALGDPRCGEDRTAEGSPEDGQRRQTISLGGGQQPGPSGNAFVRICFGVECRPHPERSAVIVDHFEVDHDRCVAPLLDTARRGNGDSVSVLRDDQGRSPGRLTHAAHKRLHTQHRTELGARRCRQRRKAHERATGLGVEDRRVRIRLGVFDQPLSHEPRRAMPCQPVSRRMRCRRCIHVAGSDEPTHVKHERRVPDNPSSRPRLRPRNHRDRCGSNTLVSQRTQRRVRSEMPARAQHGGELS